MQHQQLRLKIGLTPFVLRRPRMNDQAAGQRAARSFITENESISTQGEHRFVYRDLTIDRFLGSSLFLGTQQDDFAHSFRGSDMNTDSLMIFDSRSRGRT